jgi:predicted RecB family nuclease
MTIDINLVLLLVFDNDETFQNLSQKECKTILFTFRQELIQTNENIVHTSTAYICKNFLKGLKRNIRNLIRAKNRHNHIRSQLYMKKESELVRQALSFRYAECLRIFLLSECKESIHESMFSPYHKRKDETILNEFERIVDDMYGHDDVYNYHHNPNHFLFRNKIYMYYELMESKGINIMEPWVCSSDF